MNRTSAVIYKGWTITAMCLKHVHDHVRGPDTYTGRVISVLNDTAQAGLWSDSGPQISNIVCRVFLSFEECSVALLAEARSAIDALQHAGEHMPGLCGAIRSHVFDHVNGALRRCPAALPDVVLSRGAVLGCMHHHPPGPVRLYGRHH